MTLPTEEEDVRWMRRALAIARLGASRGEVPVGAVVVLDGVVLGEAHDGKELFGDPSAHAEMLALRRAARRLGGWRLDGADLYVTLEPCPMCAGALVHARIRRLVFGASNPRWGACSGERNLLEWGNLNHRIEVRQGVCEQVSGDLLRETFRAWRLDKRTT